jgi:hypothetical protein
MELASVVSLPKDPTLEEHSCSQIVVRFDWLKNNAHFQPRSDRPNLFAA